MLTQIDKTEGAGLLALLRQIETISGASNACRQLEETLREGYRLPPLESEELMAQATLDVRKLWLSLAHRSSDRTLKSPLVGVKGNLPTGAFVDFGYERDLDVGLLEKRGERYLPCPEGFSCATTIFRSGQSTLAALLQFSMMSWAGRHPILVAHCGAYFETATLLRKWSKSALRLSKDDEVDVVVAEPVWCDGQLGTNVADGIPTARRLLIIDTTLVNHDLDLAPWLKRLAPGALCVMMRSGLKLDQGGLELANVGIARAFGSDAEQIAEFSKCLVEIRGLNGTGLTFDEMAALSAPWFMNASYVSAYSHQIFRNNALLANVIGQASAIFEERPHPSLASPGSVAPFCCLRLREQNEDVRCEALISWLERESRKRGVRFDRGGSFGFRGHRYDLVQSNELPPFIRIAMGFGASASASGIFDMVGELAGLTQAQFDRHLNV